MFTFTSLSMANYWTAAFYFPKKCYYRCPRLIYTTLPTSLQYEAVQERKMENCLVSGLNWPFEVINGHKQALLFAHRDTVKTVFGLTSATTLRLKALAARLQWPSDISRTSVCRALVTPPVMVGRAPRYRSISRVRWKKRQMVRNVTREHRKKV